MGNIRFIEFFEFSFASNGYNCHFFGWAVPTNGWSWRLLRRQRHLQRWLSRASLLLRKFKIIWSCQFIPETSIDFCCWYEQGDDGGPMNYYNPECGRWFVLGVAGRGDFFNVGKGRPNVFTRVSAHLDFIRSHTGVANSTDRLPTTYLPTTEATTVETTIRQPFSCAGKPDGNHPDPASACSTTFYMCSSGLAYLFVSYFR